jgi:cation diffusion facilitator CzcD-associated flavoprotein CzcO
MDSERLETVIIGGGQAGLATFSYPATAGSRPRTW